MTTSASALIAGIVIAGILFAASASAQLPALAAPRAPAPRTRPLSAPAPPPAKRAPGAANKQWDAMMQRLTPKERKQLTKAIKKLSPEERKQLVESLTSGQTGKGASQIAAPRVLKKPPPLPPRLAF